MSYRTCSALRCDGQPCSAPALPSGPLCFAHEPSMTERRREARSKGAQVSNQKRALEAKQPGTGDLDALANFNGLVLRGVLSGRIRHDVGRSIFLGVSTQMKLLESSDIARRLEALEERLPAEPARQQWRAR
jgi:hypothetical protein